MHLPLRELLAGLDEIRASPTDHGRVELVVARPTVDDRTVLDEGELDCAVGLVGDNWSRRPSSNTPDGSPHPQLQLTIMNARVSALVSGLLAGGPDLRHLAGDQLHVDLDLSAANLPPGTRLAVGGAVVEVTPFPHRGCAKFVRRFGADAMRFVNSPVGAELNLRGVNARVVAPGVVRPGDPVVRLSELPAARPPEAVGGPALTPEGTHQLG